MENQKLDKYIEYVLAQIGEGQHTKAEIISDLQERGLSESEIKEVLDASWTVGAKLENEARNNSLIGIIASLGLPILMLVLLWLTGHSVLQSFSFASVVGGVIVFISILFHKKSLSSRYVIICSSLTFVRLILICYVKRKRFCSNYHSYVPSYTSRTGVFWCYNLVLDICVEIQQESHSFLDSETSKTFLSNI